MASDSAHRVPSTRARTIARVETALCPDTLEALPHARVLLAGT
jgi:hypothetical protein